MNTFTLPSGSVSETTIILSNWVFPFFEGLDLIDEIWPSSRDANSGLSSDRKDWLPFISDKAAPLRYLGGALFKTPLPTSL